MPYFLSPKVIFGKGALKRLSLELEGKGNRAALITDRTLKEKCTELVESLRAAGYEVTIWDGVEADPTLEITLAASRFLLDSNPQWVIGFGGGSAIDTAKAAWVLYERPDLAAGDLTKAILPKVKLNLRQKARFVAVPTTSGTGADIGLASAGWGARAQDASAVLTNPAGMTRLEGSQILLGAQALYGDFGFSIGPGTSPELGTGDGGNPIGWFPGGSAYPCMKPVFLSTPTTRGERHRMTIVS